MEGAPDYKPGDLIAAVKNSVKPPSRVAVARKFKKGTKP